MLLSLLFALSVSVPAVLDSLPHRTDHFTQGIFWENATLWETTGIEGRSGLYKMNRQGKVVDSLRLPGAHFGEGVAKVGDDLFWITWRSGVGYTVDSRKLAFKGTFPIPTEGWGLTVWRGQLLMSNGSAELLRLSPGDQRVTGSVRVKAQGRPVTDLNELEAVGDTLFANVWHCDSIAVIALSQGEVVRWIDLSALARRVRKTSPGAEVLNGIAWDGKHLWVTGKLWPRIFKLKNP